MEKFYNLDDQKVNIYHGFEHCKRFNKSPFDTILETENEASDLMYKLIKKNEEKEEEKEEEEENNEEEELKNCENEENEYKKCSNDKHKDIEAFLYCQECKIYMCNKCDKIHSELCTNHHQYKLGKDINDIFTGLCKEKNHSLKLDYFCENHNTLCCAACLCKIKGKGYGKHNKCNVFFNKRIKDKKKNN